MHKTLYKYNKSTIVGLTTYLRLLYAGIFIIKIL